MANFDVLRSAIIGPMAYICRPKPPLLGCWPLTSTTDKADVSTYGHNFTGTLSAATQTNSLGKVIPASNSTFPCTLDLGKPWSFDFMVGINHAAGQSHPILATLGNFMSYLDNEYGPACAMSFVGTDLGSAKTSIVYGGVHVGFSYDGSTVRRFVNGILNVSASVSMSGTSSGLSMAFSSGDLQCFGNLRIVQKCLGTDSYPVPSTFYTGYETL